MLNSSHNINNSILLPFSQAIFLRKEWQQTMQGISSQKGARLVFVQWLQKFINIPRIRQRILLISSVVLWIIHYILPQAQHHDIERVVKTTLNWLCLLSSELSGGCDEQNLLKGPLKSFMSSKKCTLYITLFNLIVQYQCKTRDFFDLDAQFPDIWLFFFSSHPLPSTSSPSCPYVCQK